MKRLLVAVGVVGIGVAVALSGASPGLTHLKPSQCARGPADGGSCFAGHDGGHALRGRTYSTGPVVFGQCELFACPVQP